MVNNLESGEAVLINCKLDNSSYCAKCCIETEMPLTRGDIERITKLGYNVADFVDYRQGIAVLRNINGHCFFLDPSTGTCKIYPHRPEGCKLYPLICVPGKGVIVDEYCPRSSTITLEIVRKFEKRVRQLVREVYKVEC